MRNLNDQGEHRLDVAHVTRIIASHLLMLSLDTEVSEEFVGPVRKLNGKGEHGLDVAHVTRLIASHLLVLSLDSEISEEFVGPVSRFPGAHHSRPPGFEKSHNQQTVCECPCSGSDKCRGSTLCRTEEVPQRSRRVLRRGEFTSIVSVGPVEQWFRKRRILEVSEL